MPVQDRTVAAPPLPSPPGHDDFPVDIDRFGPAMVGVPAKRWRRSNPIKSGAGRSW